MKYPFTLSLFAFLSCPDLLLFSGWLMCTRAKASSFREWWPTSRVCSWPRSWTCTTARWPVSSDWRCWPSGLAWWAPERRHQLKERLENLKKRVFKSSSLSGRCPWKWVEQHAAGSHHWGPKDGFVACRPPFAGPPPVCYKDGCEVSACAVSWFSLSAWMYIFIQDFVGISFVVFFAVYVYGLCVMVK